MNKNWTEKRWALRKGDEADSHEWRPASHLATGVICLVFAVILFQFLPVISVVLGGAAVYQLVVAAIENGIRDGRKGQ